MNIDFDFATRDDCLDKMVPSDLRQLVRERDEAVTESAQHKTRSETFLETGQKIEQHRDELAAIVERLRTAAIAATEEMNKVLPSLPSTMPINHWGHPRRGRNPILDKLQEALNYDLLAASLKLHDADVLEQILTDCGTSLAEARGDYRPCLSVGHIADKADKLRQEADDV